jgi:ubiquitin-activating enzyme E1
VRKIHKVLEYHENDQEAWTNGRHKPSPIEFNPEIEDHRLFINSVTLIYGRIWGIEIGTEDILQIATESELEIARIESDEIADLKTQIEYLTANGISVHPEEFEKDDDNTKHMDFIATAANLRAINYQLEPATRLEAKRIAGKIIPAMATTTAMICGFVCLEMYSVHSITQKRLEEYRSGSFNLACAHFSFTQPSPSMKFTIQTTGEEFDAVWQRIHFSREMDLAEMLNEIESTYHVNVHALRANGHTLWSDSPSTSTSTSDSISNSDSTSGDERQSVTTLDHAISRSAVRNNSRISIAIDCSNPVNGESVPLPFIQVHHLG